ncbi:MAG: AAA family ATPase [Candidatus Uhrbacteria bacterium]|nr:AAA family ATPase [Patescibacteria group bacterium]MBU1906953.1 AAA family ATPase [Patescibacteria group bacterium]
MSSLPKVVFVGGVHGAGKTTICNLLAKKNDWPVTKQRRLLIQAGSQDGYTWPEVAQHHDQYMLPTAVLAEKALTSSQTGVLLVDCHYAIRSLKALRPHTPEGNFIADLDQRFVAHLARNHLLFFILLEVAPLLAVKRFKSRPSHFLDHDNTHPGILEKSQAEAIFLAKLVDHFNISDKQVLRLSNNRQINIALAKISNLINNL